MLTRRLLYIVLLIGGLYYLTDALKIMFIDYDRLVFAVFGMDIGRLPYVIYELFIASSLLYLAFTQLRTDSDKS